MHLECFNTSYNVQSKLISFDMYPSNSFHVFKKTSSILFSQFVSFFISLTHLFLYQFSFSFLNFFMIIFINQHIMISINYILEYQIYKNSNFNRLQLKSIKLIIKNVHILLFQYLKHIFDFIKMYIIILNHSTNADLVR